MTRQKVNQSNQQSKSETQEVSGVLQRAAVRAVADKEGEATQAVESEELRESRFVHDFSQVPIGRGGLPKEASKIPNQTGLPDSLKAGVENLSGYSLDDVRVYYNSPKPSQLQALAYTQGTEIHVAPGHEKHLPHEAWHVVQQMQGRVKPTMQMKGVQINNDKGLEGEADVMGNKIIQLVNSSTETITQMKTPLSMWSAKIIQRALTVKETTAKGWTLSGRPGFRVFVKRTLVDYYNSVNGTAHDPETISLTDEELDQCHKISWENIRKYVENYLNGNVLDSDFRKEIAVNLYNNEVTEESLDAMGKVEEMITAKNKKNLGQELIKEVCTLLNSATPNLRLDDKYINRKIKQHFDPHLEYSPGGTHLTATPHTKILADSDMVTAGVKYSPGGTHGYSSSVGIFNRGDLSPDTAKRGAFK